MVAAVVASCVSRRCGTTHSITVGCAHRHVTACERHFVFACTGFCNARLKFHRKRERQLQPILGYTICYALLRFVQGGSVGDTPSAFFNGLINLSLFHRPVLPMQSVVIFSWV
jgi:hypothetical protein